MLKPDLIKIRHLIQLAFFVTTCAVGIQFYLYVKQASGSGVMTIPRPIGVEGFLPIGALMGWKRFFLTGEWDIVHPASMVILGFAVLISFFFHKAFCSWFCPVGTLSEWLWKIGKGIFGRNFALPKWLDYILRALKYILLGIFLYVVLTMPLPEISAFIESPYYKVSDVKMLRFFTHMSLTTAIVLTVITIGSLFIKNFWCRYACPYGALTGLFGLISISRIKRNSNNCIDCGQCSEVCPHTIDVKTKTQIFSAECSLCMDCIEVCPVDQTLSIQTVGLPKHKSWSTKSLGATIVILFWCLIYIATITGYWQTRLSQNENRSLIKRIDSPHISHPGLN